MRFGTFLLRIGGTRDAELDDLKRVCDIGPKTFQPDGQKNLYVIDTCIIDERFSGWHVIMMMQSVFAIMW